MADFSFAHMFNSQFNDGVLQIKPVSGSAGGAFPRGLSKFVDRSTLELCLHLVVLSLALVR